MTDKRLRKIFDKVVNKVVDSNPNLEHGYEMVHRIYRAVGQVIRMLHKTEHFLNVYINHNKRYIIARDEETLKYLGVLPYLDFKLVESGELYLVYYVTTKPRRIEELIGAVHYIDCFDGDINTREIGLKPILTSKDELGMYVLSTNKFYTLRRKEE